MNELFATWRHPVDVDLDAGLDAADLLARAHRQLREIPELADALHLVDVALAEVSDWFDLRAELHPGQCPQGGLDLREVGAPRHQGPVALHADAPFEQAAAEERGGRALGLGGDEPVGAELDLVDGILAVEPAVELSRPLAADQGPVPPGRSLVEVVDDPR